MANDKAVSEPVCLTDRRGKSGSRSQIVILLRTHWHKVTEFMAPLCNNRELKKLRRQLQRKRHIKIELCVKLSLLRLLHVDHIVQLRRTALSLAWYEWFSCKGKE